MANLNRIILVGKLTNDPEVRVTVEGLQVAKFQLGVERYVADGAQKQIDNIDIVAWRRLAEICGQYMKKGGLVLVEGRIQVRTYNDESGVRKWATEVVARSIKILGGTAQKTAAPAAAEHPADEVPGVDELPEEESDLPF
jgi:single-strand DNA-binding protein